jgi:hypothetical protein
LRIPGGDEPEPETYLNDAFAAFGLVPEADLQVEEEFHLWPENVAVFNLWLSIQTQWHSDSGTRTGLDYPGVEICIRNMAVPKNERQRHFAAIQAMERAALDEWAQHR